VKLWLSPPRLGTKLMDTNRQTLNIVFRKDEDGGFVAECLEIPGCLSQGDTEEEAKANIFDAINACLAVMLEDAIKAGGPARSKNFVGIEKQETVVIDSPHILQPLCA